jgi:short-subunit dehydrogenase
MSRGSRSRGRDVAGLVVVVTGGARGIGRATVDRLARAGCRVALGDVDADLAADVAGEHDGRVVAARLDVTAPESWTAFLDATAALGPVDVLVNNAGIMPLGPLLEEPDAVSRRIVEVNLFGVVHGTKAVVPGMVERGRGHVVNVASAVGRVAVANGATYSASKHAVVGFSEALRGELAPAGVEVSMVMPTVVRTELAAGVAQARGLPDVTPEEVAAVIEDVIRRPRAERWVPGWTQPMAKVTQALPRRVQEAMSRAFAADALLADVDEDARAAYEERARRG